jgi:hypothetical protein
LRVEIKKELGDMESKKVLETIKKVDVLLGRLTIKCKWNIKIKRNGIFRAGLVACGYSQISGIDFNESFAPVIKNLNFRIKRSAKLTFYFKLKLSMWKQLFCMEI